MTTSAHFNLVEDFLDVLTAARAFQFTRRWPSLRLGSDGDHVAEGRETRERLALQLPHPFTGQIEFVPDRLECPRLALEAEAQLENPALPLR